MYDSQTSNSRLSSELCCKGQLRSNNNSALSDTTRSPDYSDMPPLEIVPADELQTALPNILLKQSNWVTSDTERRIQEGRGDESCTTCHLCQLHFTTPRRLRVHVPQHYITTFCPCGEYSYHRDYILRHQRTMACFSGYLYDVDEHYFPTFLNLIRPCITDTSRYERLVKKFPSPRAITHGPSPAPPGYKKKSKPPPSPPVKTVPRPKTLPRVVLQRIEIPQEQLSSSTPSSPPARKRRRQSPSPPPLPSRHSLGARNLLEVDERISTLTQEVHRLTPRIQVAASELTALRKSVSRLKREQKD